MMCGLNPFQLLCLLIAAAVISGTVSGFVQANLERFYRERSQGSGK